MAQASFRHDLVGKNVSFDDYCHNISGKWERIDQDFYFKRAAMLYFIDLKILRLNSI
jgi:hypothetical protein